MHYIKYFKGGKVGGLHKDYEAEIDTIPALLQAGEAVIPRVYVPKVNQFLKANKLPLPLPSKVEKVMHEFKKHKLKTSSGKLITNKKQALAVALSEARKAYKKI
jgi:hypothetical protein